MTQNTVHTERLSDLGDPALRIYQSPLISVRFLLPDDRCGYAPVASFIVENRASRNSRTGKTIGLRKLNAAVRGHS